MYDLLKESALLGSIGRFLTSPLLMAAHGGYSGLALHFLEKELPSGSIFGRLTPGEAALLGGALGYGGGVLGRLLHARALGNVLARGAIGRRLFRRIPVSYYLI